jgi:hypothetical protein
MMFLGEHLLNHTLNVVHLNLSIPNDYNIYNHDQNESCTFYYNMGHI